jgi:hypothetical protein
MLSPRHEEPFHEADGEIRPRDRGRAHLRGDATVDPPLGAASRHDEKDDREQGEQGDENEQEPQERKHALRQYHLGGVRDKMGREGGTPSDLNVWEWKRRTRACWSFW